MGRLKPALVEGKRARFWRIAGDSLYLIHPEGLAETSVPREHLTNDERMEAHYLRLLDKGWVRQEAIDELRRIARWGRTA